MNKLKRKLSAIGLKLGALFLHTAGYKFAAVKEKDGKIHIDGDYDLIRYLDTDSYIWRRPPVIRKQIN